MGLGHRFTIRLDRTIRRVATAPQSGSAAEHHGTEVGGKLRERKDENGGLVCQQLSRAVGPQRFRQAIEKVHQRRRLRRLRRSAVSAIAGSLVSAHGGDQVQILFVAGELAVSRLRDGEVLRHDALQCGAHRTVPARVALSFLAFALVHQRDGLQIGAQVGRIPRPARQERHGIQSILLVEVSFHHPKSRTRLQPRNVHGNVIKE